MRAARRPPRQNRVRPAAARDDRARFGVGAEPGPQILFKLFSGPAFLIMPRLYSPLDQFAKRNARVHGDLRQPEHFRVTAVEQGNPAVGVEHAERLMHVLDGVAIECQLRF